MNIELSDTPHLWFHYIPEPHFAPQVEVQVVSQAETITALQQQLTALATQFQASYQKTDDRFNTVASLLKTVLPST